MGLGVSYLDFLNTRGVFGRGRRILDIGAQNLFSATAEHVRKFVKEHNDIYDDAELDEFARRMELGGVWKQELNGYVCDSFISELLEKAGMGYCSIDVIDRPGNLALDLNFRGLPHELVGTFDSCLNFGTSEHILNQVNVFNVVHESVKVGGLMCHQVPCLGHIDHGYFTYSPMFFVELAHANNYEVIDIWLGTGVSTRLFDTVRFEREKMRDTSLFNNNVDRWDNEITIHNTCITVLLRKQSDEGLRLPLETTTSVHAIAPGVRERYRETWPTLQLRAASGWRLQDELKYRYLRRLGLQK